jgi:hypothetical protein
MIDFPDAPVVGQIFSAHRSSWVWDGVKWDVSSAHPRYIVACFVPDKLKANQSLLMHRFSKNVTFPIDFGSYLGHVSEIRGGFAATANVTISIMQATAAAPGSFTAVASGLIPAGALLGTLSTSGVPLNFAEGDTMGIFAPATVDATFGDFAANLVGFET